MVVEAVEGWLCEQLRGGDTVEVGGCCGCGGG